MEYTVLWRLRGSVTSSTLPGPSTLADLEQDLQALLRDTLWPSLRSKLPAHSLLAPGLLPAAAVTYSLAEPHCCAVRQELPDSPTGSGTTRCASWLGLPPPSGRRHGS